MSGAEQDWTSCFFGQTLRVATCQRECGLSFSLSRVEICCAWAHTARRQTCHRASCIKNSCSDLIQGARRKHKTQNPWEHLWRAEVKKCTLLLPEPIFHINTEQRFPHCTWMTFRACGGVNVCVCGCACLCLCVSTQSYFMQSCSLLRISESGCAHPDICPSQLEEESGQWRNVEMFIKHQVLQLFSRMSSASHTHSLLSHDRDIITPVLLLQPQRRAKTYQLVNQLIIHS